MRGSVRRRGKGWWAVIDLPRGEDGRRRQRGRTFRTKREAEEWLARMNADIADGYADPGRLTVAEYLDTWLASMPHLKPNTLHRYRQALWRFRPLIGHLSLAKLTPIHLQQAVNALTREVSTGTVRTHFCAIRTALRQARAWGLLARVPTDGVKLPRNDGREMRVWTEAEAAAFLRAAAEKPRYEVLFRLLLASSMRLGEALGLRWADVDWERSGIHVTHTLSWPSGGRPELLPPKTASSAGFVALDEGTMTALWVHRIRQNSDRLSAGPAWQELDLVFATRTGGFLNPRWISEVFRRLAAKASVPQIRLHDLRHTGATILLRRGRSVREVADRLRHKDPAITLRIYSHVLPDQRTDVARVMGEVLDVATATVPMGKSNGSNEGSDVIKRDQTSRVKAQTKAKTRSKLGIGLPC